MVIIKFNLLFDLRQEKIYQHFCSISRILRILRITMCSVWYRLRGGILQRPTANCAFAANCAFTTTRASSTLIPLSPFCTQCAINI